MLRLDHRLRFRHLRRVAKFLAFLVCAAWTATLLELSVSASGLDNEVLCAKSLGIMQTAAQLNAYGRTPAVENAAHLYRQAMHLPIAKSNGWLSDGSALDMASEPSGLFIPSAFAYLQLTREKTAIATRIGDLQHCKFSRNWNLGYAVTFPELSVAKSLSRQLLIRSILMARVGEVEATLKDLHRIERMAKHMTNDPCTMSFLVGMSIHNSMLMVCETIATVWSRDTRSLAQLGKFVENAKLPFTVKDSIMATAGLDFVAASTLPISNSVNALFDGPVSFEYEFMIPPLIGVELARNGIRRHHFEYWNKLIELCSRVNWEPRAVNGVMKAFPKAEFDSWRPSVSMASYLTPELRFTVEAYLKSEARQLLLNSLIRAVQSRAKNPVPYHNRELEDPFSGKPILVKKLGAAIAFTSVGPNGKDEISDAHVGDSRLRGDDIIMRFPAVRNFWRIGINND